MNLNNYKYVNTTKITGDIVLDVTNFLLKNNRHKQYLRYQKAQ